MLVPLSLGVVSVCLCVGGQCVCEREKERERKELVLQVLGKLQTAFSCYGQELLPVG